MRRLRAAFSISGRFPAAWSITTHRPSCLYPDWARYKEKRNTVRHGVTVVGLDIGGRPISHRNHTPRSCARNCGRSFMGDWRSPPALNVCAETPSESTDSVRMITPKPERERKGGGAAPVPCPPPPCPALRPIAPAYDDNRPRDNRATFTSSASVEGRPKASAFQRLFGRRVAEAERFGDRLAGQLAPMGRKPRTQPRIGEDRRKAAIGERQPERQRRVIERVA